MSKKHPIIAVTGSSGAGTTTVRTAFEHIFFREKISPCVVEGDAFHRFDRQQMREQVAKALAEGWHLSHFGPEGNHLDKLEALFHQYSETGTGRRRYYLHNELEAQHYGQTPGTFTPWEDIPAGTDVLFYEGLHGALASNGVNVAQYVDLLIGVVPIVNLEWIQKIHRDTGERGYKPEDVTENILRRMYDYVNYITPQFSLTDINFQRVPTVDTSNPFVARDIPTADESFVVIRFRDPVKFDIDFPYLLAMIHDSFMSRRNTIVIPGGKMGLAIEIIFAPIIDRLMNQRRELLKAA
jgi:phosphoribulokinase